MIRSQTSSTSLACDSLPNDITLCIPSHPNMSVAQALNDLTRVMERKSCTISPSGHFLFAMETSHSHGTQFDIKTCLLHDKINRDQ